MILVMEKYKVQPYTRLTQVKKDMIPQAEVAMKSQPGDVIPSTMK